MEPLKTTTARLRRTFAYPTDDSTTSADNSPEALDEEEQEALIATLADQNESRNAQFRRLLFALPALSSIPYLVSLARGGGYYRPQSALLALTSLASTAWLLYYLPPAETGIPYLDGGPGRREEPTRPAVGRSDEDEDDDTVAALRSRRERRERRASSFSVAAARAGPHRTPLQRWLPYLNLGLCGVLFAIGVLRGAKQGGRDSLIADLLPAVVYAGVLAAKMVMAGVDPETELGGLRYGYKGA